MKFSVIILLFLILCQTPNIYSQSTWFQINPYPQARSLNAVKFIDQNTGIACGDSGVIIRTTNGGLNWSMNVMQERTSLKAISFADAQTGFICGAKKLNSLIFKTINSGVSWEAINTGVPMQYNSIFFVNQNTGYACGGLGNLSGKLLKTTDSGNSWNLILQDSNIFYQVFFPDELTGYITGRNSRFLKTINAGANWTAINNISPSISSLFFTSSNTGFCSGFYGPVFKTTNAGVNWTQQDLLGIKKFYFYSEQIGFGIGSTGIIKTTNNGDNWVVLNTNPSHIFNDMHFFNESTGYVIGSRTNYGGIITKTTDGGNTWLNIDTGYYDYLYGIDFATNDLGYITGYNGTILKTTNGGITFNNFSNSILPKEFLLLQNYPNPFNPKTIINYELPASHGERITSFVTLKVYDVLGNEVASLVNERENAGAYEVEFDGSNLSSGIYFYRLEADGNIIDTKRMVFLK